MIIGAQLYNLRKFAQTEKDIERSLEKVAEMGYTTVQASGIGNIAPERLRSMCDRLSLKIVLTHTDKDRILNDTERVIEEHDILGCKYIGIGSMGEKYTDIHWYENFAKDYREPMRKIAAAGKLFMYHNHSFEFGKLGDKLLMERLMEDFSAEEMGFTLDTYWVQNAGADVCDWIDKLKGRLPCVHIKDMAVVNGVSIMAPVMEGNLNFPKILKHFEAAGTEYAIVEQDNCIGSPFDCLKQSYDNLRTLGYK